MRRPSRRWAHPLAALLLVAGEACGASTSPPRLLRSYQLQLPQRQLGRVLWLADLASDELGGTLSPDGRWLAYASDQKGNFDIWLKDLTTGLPRRLTDDPAEDTQPAWAPDGHALAFVSTRADAKGDVYLWRNGRLRRLTDARTADGYPAFAPDGRTLYFSAGESGRERIQRLTLASGRIEAVTTSGATHAALSADGRWLAYTRSTTGAVARIELLPLDAHGGRRVRVLPTDEPSGFPAFTPDGHWLVFCRFRRGPAHQLRTPDATASLWRLPLAALQSPVAAGGALASAEQLTSDGADALLPRAHARGLVITARRAGSLDIGLLPTSGLVPATLPGPALRELARGERDPWARLLLWQRLIGDPLDGSEAQYESAQLWQRLDQPERARQALATLAATRQPPQGPAAVFVARAQIDLALLSLGLSSPAGSTAPLAAATAPAKTARSREQERARMGLERLAQLEPRLASSDPAARGYLLLCRAALAQRAHALPSALAQYQEVIADYAAQRDLVARAQLALGAIYARVQAPELVARYFLGLLAGPDQRLAEDVAQALVALHAGAPVATQRELLRALLDQQRPPPAVAARLHARLAALHEAQGELEAALASLAAALRQPALDAALAAELGFELGRLALRHSRELRQSGRQAAALAHYDRALRAFARIMRESDPASEMHLRARRAHLRLALLDAAQLVDQGAHALAAQRYRQLLAVDDEVLQAHRGLLALGASTARDRPDPQLAWGALAAPYRRRVERDGSDAVALYALGYLATLRTPLRLADLDEAERWLKRAVALRPQSPFGHLTLGWVFEMRERYFGERQRGWLEEAAQAYEQAHALNDAGLDPQTEADLLVNLANVFAALGNGWREVVGYCARRRALAQPFGTPEQEAFHRLSCGRAAAATGAHAVAAADLEQALRLARKLGLAALEVQVLAQLGLNAQLHGALASSHDWLSEAVARVARAGQVRALAVLQRTLAYNAVLQRDARRATERLHTAEQALARWGTLAPPAFLPVAPRPDPSTLPLGLDGVAERQALRALREMLAQQQHDGPAARRLQDQVLAAQEQRLAGQDLPELRRELLLLRNRSALLSVRQGDRATFGQRLDQALREARALREPAGALDPQSFALEVGLALNRAEELLEALASGQGVARDALARSYELLLELERRRARGRASGAEVRPAATTGEAPAEPPVLGERLRLALWTDLALLALHLAPLAANSDAVPQTSGALAPSRAVLARLASAWAGPPRSRVEKALARLLARLRPGAQAVELLQRVFAETDPARAPVPEVLPDAPPPAGATATLWRPLTPAERHAWHVAVALALARAGAAAVDPTALEAHPSSELLRQAARATVGEDLGAQRFALSAELAYRRRDARAIDAAVAGLLEHHPLLLLPVELAEATALRGSVFGRAIALAFDQGDATAALRYAELAERRAFLDELVALGPTGEGVVGGALTRLLASALRYREHARQADPALPEAAQERWGEDLRARRRAVALQLQTLARISPAVGELLTVSAFPLAELQQALPPDAVALRLLDDGRRVALLALRHEGPPRLHPLPQPVAALRALAATERARLLRAPLAAAARGAGSVWLDLGPLDDQPLRAESLGLDPRRTIRLATLWALLDARAVRRFPLPAVVHLAAAPRRSLPAAEGPPEALQLRPLRAAALAPPTLEQQSSRSGLLWIDLPQRWLGGSAANLALQRGPGHAPWRWAQRLGLLLDSAVAVLPDPGLEGPGRRARLVALLRLLHAAGVPAVALPTEDRLDPVPDAGALASTLPAAWVRTSGLSIVEALAPLGLALFGDVGVEPSARRDTAQAELKRLVQRGAKAFNAAPRDLATTIAALQPALHHMTFLGDTRLQAGALLYLANAHGLREDYPRALAVMAELVALRRAAFAAAERGAPAPAAVLRAKAELVTALRQLAWLQLRHRQFDAALATNAETVAIYEQVRRPALLREALEQRGTIAEGHGAYVEALRAARRSLELSTRLAAPPGADRLAATATGLAAAQDALRVAQLLRQRFARFREATSAVAQALRWLPATELTRLPRQPAALAPLRATLGARAAATLELARIASARGVYSEAVRQARAALGLLGAAGLPEDAARLELVNALYYAGALAEALEAAERGLVASAQDPARRLQFLNARGTTLAALGRSVAALETLQRALAAAREQRRESEIAATLNNLGFAQRLAGRGDDAVRSFGDALVLDRARGDVLGSAFALANRGLALLQLERHGEAREDLQQALKLAQGIRAALNELKAHHGLARLELAQGQAPPALAHAETGLARARQVGQRAWVWRFGLLRGRALRALGRNPEAREALEQSAALVDTLPPQVGEAPGASGGEEPPSAVYDELVDLLAATGAAEAGLAVAERARARAGADAGAAALSALRGTPVGEALQRLLELRRQQEALRGALLQAGGDARERALLGAEGERLALELAQAEAALGAQRPRLLRLLAPPAWDGGAVARALQRAPEALAVVYHVTAQRLVSWVLQARAAQPLSVAMSVVALPRGRLLSTIGTLREGLTRWDELQPVLRQLSAWLVHPLAGAARGRARAWRIIAPAPLDAVPFAALEHEGAALAARVTLTHAPSLAWLGEPVARAAADPRGPWVSLVWDGDRARPLPLAAHESEALGRSAAELLAHSGAEATRQALLEALASGRQVHLATHAGRGAAAEGPSLALADGELASPELLGAPVSAPLVVLSACEGVRAAAGGGLGLDTALLLAGATQVVATSSRVSDLAAALLMKHFFRQRARGLDPAAALQQAQLLLRARWPHPAAWATFRVSELGQPSATPPAGT